MNRSQVKEERQRTAAAAAAQKEERGERKRVGGRRLTSLPSIRSHSVLHTPSEIIVRKEMGQTIKEGEKKNNKEEISQRMDLCSCIH